MHYIVSFPTLFSAGNVITTLFQKGLSLVSWTLHFSSVFSWFKKKKKVPLSPWQHSIFHHSPRILQCRSQHRSVKCEKKLFDINLWPLKLWPIFFFLIIIMIIIMMLWKTLATAWISGLVFPRYGLSLFPFKWSRICVCCFFFSQFGDTFFCPFYNSVSRVGCVLVKPF